jgi:hypothetical protein
MAGKCWIDGQECQYTTGVCLRDAQARFCQECAILKDFFWVMESDGLFVEVVETESRILLQDLRTKLRLHKHRLLGEVEKISSLIENSLG